MDLRRVSLEKNIFVLKIPNCFVPKQLGVNFVFMNQKNQDYMTNLIFIMQSSVYKQSYVYKKLESESIFRDSFIFMLQFYTA